MKLDELTDKIADRLAEEGLPVVREELVAALVERRQEVAYTMGVTPRTAEQWFNDRTVEAWVKNIREGAQKLGYTPAL